MRYSELLKAQIIYAIKKEIPFNGKLFIEGAAAWLSFKILDHFDVKRDTQINSFGSFNEYQEGFLLLNWLEDRVGINGVLNFLKTGKIKIDGILRDVNYIITRRGLDSKFNQWE